MHQEHVRMYTAAIKSPQSLLFLFIFEQELSCLETEMALFLWDNFSALYIGSKVTRPIPEGSGTLQ